MELEIVKPKSKFFEELNIFDTFLWLGNLFIKISNTDALNTTIMFSLGFCGKEEVTPCEIQKIIVKKC